MKISSRMAEIKPSATLAITARARQLRAEGMDVVSFTAGEPDFDTPEHIKAAAVEAIKQGFTKYTPTTGIQELKAAIVKKFKADNGLDYDASQIVVSCGAKHSLYNVLQVLLEPGDEVIIPSPFWLSYPEMVKLAGGTPKIVPTREEEGFRLNEKELRRSISKKTKVLIINSPANPTGGVYREEDLEILARITAETAISLISDEIYEKLIYDGRRHVSVASLGKEICARTVVVNGVSKSYSMTGWRIGYLAAPKEVAEAVSRLQDHSTSNPTSIAQKAALAALTGDDSFVKKMAGEYARRRDYLVERIQRTKELSCRKPEGAFYVFVNVSRTGIPARELARRLLEEARVAVIPGEDFGSSGHVRLSFACGQEEIAKGMDRIEEWLKNKV